MDIIHLLEVLNPAGNVVTVKIDNGKSTWDTVSDFLVAVSPVVVALLALLLSHRQFKKNLSQQALQFQSGVRRQLNELRLNTQLATEIEIKKENCRDVRTACVNFLEYADSYYTNKFLYAGYSKTPQNRRDENYSKLIDDTFNASVEDNKKIASSRAYLKTFLDPVKDKIFLGKIDKVFEIVHQEITDNLVDDLGEAKKVCLIECQIYISSIHQDIIKLSENIKVDD